MQNLRRVWPLGIFLLILIGGIATVSAQDGGEKATKDDGLAIFLPFQGEAARPPYAPPGPDPVDPHPGEELADFESADFSGPAICQSCHGELQDANTTEVTPSLHWRSTMMANGARDPLFLAKVSSEIVRNPDLQGVIEETCSRCHMPLAYTEAEAFGHQPRIFGDGFINPQNEYHQLAQDGISCTLCHQIQPDGLGLPESFEGHYVIDVSTQPPHRELFGPYLPDNMGRAIMRSGTGYTIEQGVHLQKSILCATCHTLFTPTIVEGEVVGLFPEQVAYLEWLHSDYGDGIGEDRQCQDCHMPVAAGGVSLFPGWPPRQPFNQHYFVGGNVFMLRILQANVEALGLRASTDHLQATIDRTMAQLQARTAGLSLVEAEIDENDIKVELAIASLVGHKYPTGYPARRTWIHLTVTDSLDRVIFDSGRPLIYGGIQGNDADLDDSTFEPHYEQITDPQQVQIYEAIMGDSDGKVTNTLLEAATYLKDNRLLPQGFDKESASEDVAVQGLARDDEDFTAGGDRITYYIQTDGYPGPYRVSVELLYQSVSYQFIRDLQRDNTQPVLDFMQLYNDSDRRPVQVDHLQFDVPTP